MRLRDRLKAASNAFRQKGSAPDEQLLLDQLLNFLGISSEVTGTALAEATYFACIKVLSEGIGKLPIRVLQTSARSGVNEVRDHPFWRTLHTRPNPFMTATTFWSLMESCRNHYGNAYAFIDSRKASEPRLWPLDPQQVTLYYDNALRLADQPDIYYRVVDENGRMDVYKSEEVLHFKSFLTRRGLLGISVREQLVETIAGQMKSQKLINSLYDNGMTAKATLQFTGGLNEENVEEMIKLVNKYAASSNTGNIIPLPVGFSMQPLNLKLADSQFFEVRQATALQIAAAFGVKPSQIGDYSKSSYASAEAQQLSFLVDTLLYIVEGYAQELTSKILSAEEESSGLSIKAQTDVLLRADAQTQIDTYSKAVGSFIYTPNEARAKLDMPAREGGDRLIGNGATISLEAVGSQYVNS